MIGSIHKVLQACTAGTIFMFAAPSAVAQEAPSFASNLWTVFVPMMVVLAALLGALVLVNRWRGLSRSAGPLSVLQVVPLGSRERVVVVRAGAELFVLGVTAEQITLLSILDPSVMNTAS